MPKPLNLDKIITYRSIVPGSQDGGAYLQIALGSCELVLRVTEQQPLVDE